MTTSKANNTTSDPNLSHLHSIWFASQPIWLQWIELPGTPKPRKFPLYPGRKAAPRGKRRSQFDFPGTKDEQRAAYNAPENEIALDSAEDRALLVPYPDLQMQPRARPGYALGPLPNGYVLCGVDLDDCFEPDGSVIESLRMFVEQARIACAMIERSVGGTGLHIVWATEPEHVPATRTDTVEVYSGGRYFAWGSGVIAPGGPAPVDMTRVLGLLPPKPAKTVTAPVLTGAGIDPPGGRNNFLREHLEALARAGAARSIMADAIFAKNDELADPLEESEIRSTILKGIDKLMIRRTALPSEVFGPVEGYTDTTGGEKTPQRPAAQPLQALPLNLFLERYAEAPHWVVDHILPKGALYALTAVWGHFKTALALAVSKAVAEGGDFNGHATSKGRVLYLCGENPHDVALRLTAMFDGEPVPENFMVFPFPFALDDAKAREGFVEHFMGLTFDLVVIDTGPAYTQREEENDNAAAHALAMAFRALIEPLGRPCVLALMHPVKNAGKDNLQPRGGGAFSGSIDGELCAWAETLPNGAKTVEFFHRPKFRGPGFRPMLFGARPVLLPQFRDNFGRPAETIVLVPEVVTAPRAVKEPRGANAITAWRVINQSGERDQKALLKLIAAKLPVPGEGKADKRTDRAAEALKALQNQRYIALQDGQVQVLVGAGVFTAVA